MAKKQAASTTEMKAVGTSEKKAVSKSGKSLNKKTSSGGLLGILAALPPISVTIQDFSFSYAAGPMPNFYNVTASATLVFPLELSQAARIDLKRPDGTVVGTVTLVDPNGTTGQPEIWKSPTGATIGFNPKGLKAQLSVSCSEQLTGTGSSGITIP
jgi:hypothetical protein